MMSVNASTIASSIDQTNVYSLSYNNNYTRRTTVVIIIYFNNNILL
jgi:hypothetical protein